MLLLLFSRGAPPVVYTHHFPMHFGSPVLDQLGGFYDRSKRRLVSRCAHVVATSEYYADHFRMRHPRVAVIPWGTRTPVATDRFDQYDGSRPLRVLAVGQFRKYKGMGVLVSAVLGLDSVHVTLAGDGPTISSVRSQVPSGVNNVDFAGKVTDSELEDLYWQSDVVALPSTTRAEAFGIVLLEGMAHGCVPVASDLPGVSEVVGTTGCLARPGDPQSLRRVLVGLADDPDEVELRKKLGFERMENYSWERVVDSYEALFFEVADQRARGRAQ
jgi:rhamnosyl/mannosyltransferase